MLIVLDEVRLVKFGADAWATLGLLGFVLLCGVTKALPLTVAALTGACALVLFRLVRPDEVRRTVDWSVLLLIGGMLSLGLAFEKYRLDDRVAGWLTHLGDQGLPAHGVLAVVLVASMVLTQLMSHVAAAVVMTPVALSLAAELGASDRPFVMAVLTGASCSFMSPVAHQANAMVMGPGEYRYRDFVRAGAPLTALLLLAAWFLLPLFFPF
jgi:di/tricarboxylate transporter